MTCQDMMDLMQRSLDLDLSAAEERVMLAHLQGCPSCADLYERLKLLTGELAQLPKVVPPYSIVDSIMPQLEGLVGLSEPGAAADTTYPAQGDELAARREKKGLISWKIVSGIAAAGIVLGMYVFNLGPGRVSDKAAEEISQPRQEMKNSATAKSGSADANFDKFVAMDVANETTAPAATGQTLTAGNSSPATAKQPAASSASKQEDPIKEGRQVSAASRGEGVPSQTPLKSIDQYGSPVSTAKPQDVAGGAAKGSAADLNTAPSAASENPVAAAATPTPKAEAAGNGDAQMSGIASLPAPELAPAPDGSTDDKRTGSIYGFAASAKTAPSTIQPMSSEDGSYTAQLVERSVTITGKDSQELFRSDVQLAAGDILTFKGWTEGGYFTYSIKKPDGQEKSYRISVQEKKEAVQ